MSIAATHVDRVRQVVVILMSGWVAALAPSCSAAALTRFTYTEYHMGVDARLVVYASSESVAQSACKAAFDRIAELDSMMSDYRKNSELTLVCDKAGGPPTKVSPELFKVLWHAQEMSRKSGGAFDVTVGPLVQLWRTARKTHVLPEPKAIAQARRLVGRRKLKLDPRAQTVQLTVAGMRLDLGAIAKGYADDEAQRVLKLHGVSCALVQMGGDIVVSDPPPGKKGWTILIPNARGDGKDLDLRLVDCAISTSGDEEQHVVIGGVRYSHVIDARTGRPITNRIEVTVTARDGFTSDPLSTTLTLLGPKARARILKAYPGSKVYVRIMPAD